MIQLNRLTTSPKEPLVHWYRISIIQSNHWIRGLWWYILKRPPQAPLLAPPPPPLGVLPNTTRLSREAPPEGYPFQVGGSLGPGSLVGYRARSGAYDVICSWARLKAYKRVRAITSWSGEKGWQNCQLKKGLKNISNRRT